MGLQPHFSITVDSFEDCAATAEAAAIAQERLKQELAHGSQGGAKVESSERNEGRRWGPDAFKDSGPPGSSLLGDVVREVEAKRNVGFEEGSRAGSPNQIESGSDAGMSVQADSSRSRGVAGQARGSKRGDTEGMVRRDSGDGERNEGAPEQRNGTDSGVSAPSVDDLSSQRTSGGAADKPWWDIIMDHPAFKRDGREAPSGSGRSRDGVVVNRGPGWEIVRRGPFWNRQYVLEQVAEGADAGGRPAAEGQRGLSGRQENAARGGKADAERRIGEGPVEERKESRGEGLREAKGRGDGEHDNGHVGSPPIEGHPQGAEGVSHPKYETGDSGEDPGVTSSLPGQSGRSAGMSERSEQTQAACGRFISQQEWNAVKAAVKDKLKGSAGTSADVRQQKWEALKASVEAKLALKYRERGAGWSAAGGTSTSFEVEDSTRPFGHGQVESGRRVAGEGGSVAKGKTRSLGDGVHGKKKPLEMGVQVDQRSKARHGAAEAAAGQLGVAGVVRDEARMALIAVMAGSPQERDLQGALDAVTRDIHGKSANGSEASMMFIGNVGSLFVPLGTRSGGPQAGML